MLKESYLPQISADKNFQQLVHPLPPHNEIRDAEFYIRRDGIIFNADGYAHPPDAIVGAVLYAPNQHGNKRLFDIKYTKTTLFPGTYEPIPYAMRGEFLRILDPDLDQTGKNSIPFTYEQILPIEQFVGYIPAEYAYNTVTTGVLGDPEQIMDDLSDLIRLLDINLAEFALGFTGTLALGQIHTYHDLDIMFRGTVRQNRALADKMKELVVHEPERRLHEGGKSWLIRFYNKNGVTDGSLICCFFGYQKLEDASLRTFAMKILEQDMEISASVSDATHALYTPTIVNLYDIQASIISEEKVKERFPDNLPLIIYHTASRGELNYGDRVRAHGALVEVVTPQVIYPALVVIEREGVRNETPPWSDFYTRERI